jgi:hypothetical protein
MVEWQASAFVFRDGQDDEDPTLRQKPIFCHIILAKVLGAKSELRSRPDHAMVAAAKRVRQRLSARRSGRARANMPPRSV